MIDWLFLSSASDQTADRTVYHAAGVLVVFVLIELEIRTKWRLLYQTTASGQKLHKVSLRVIDSDFKERKGHVF